MSIGGIVGSGGSGGLSEAQVDARVVAVAGDSLNGYTFSTGVVADDNVYVVDFGKDILAGNLIVTTHIAGGSHRGIFTFRASATAAFCVAIAATGLTAATGVLTGTTGGDGILTVSAHTDRKLYIENRRGGDTIFNVTINSGYL